MVVCKNEYMYVSPARQDESLGGSFSEDEVVAVRKKTKERLFSEFWKRRNACQK